MYLRGEKYYWNKPKEDGFELTSKTLELGYWRKHPDLHGFIVQTYSPGGIDDCARIDLVSNYLTAIVIAVRKGMLPETTGFFFGNSEGKGKSDVEIFTNAREWLETKEKGVSRTIFYQASW